MRSVLIAASVALSASSIAAPESDYSVRQTRRLAYDYAKCVVGHHPVKASEAILSVADNRTIMSRYWTLIDGGCLVRTTRASAKMTFPGELYRYALADALVARELASSPTPDLANVPLLPREALPEQPAPLQLNADEPERRRYEAALKGFAEAQAFRALDELGECVVRLNTAGAKALLLISPEKPAEAAAFDALRPALEQCLPEGRTFSLGKLVFRGTVAVNYYRLTHAASSVAAR